MSYRAALGALEAYEPKRLIAGEFRSCDGECCALGAVCPETWERGTYEALDLFAYTNALGLRYCEARDLIQANDRFSGTPEERYQHVLGWLRARA